VAGPIAGILVGIFFLCGAFLGDNDSCFGRVCSFAIGVFCIGISIAAILGGGWPPHH
jgi:hypothetical protein